MSYKFSIHPLLYSPNSLSVCNSSKYSCRTIIKGSGASRALSGSTRYISWPASSSLSFNVNLELRYGILNYLGIVFTTRLIFLPLVFSTWCQTSLCWYSQLFAYGIYEWLPSGKLEYQQSSLLDACAWLFLISTMKNNVEEEFHADLYNRALAASIVRVVFSAITNGSHDSTYTMTQVGVCTFVIPTPNLFPQEAADHLPASVSWQPASLSVTS